MWKSGLAGAGSYYAVPLQQNMAFSLINSMQKAGKKVFVVRTEAKTPEVIFPDPPQDPSASQGTNWGEIISGNKILAAHSQLAVKVLERQLALHAVSDLPKGATPLQTRSRRPLQILHSLHGRRLDPLRAGAIRIRRQRTSRTSRCAPAISTRRLTWSSSPIPRVK